MREGSALLQGLAACGRCGRKLKVYYSGRKSTPGYHCSGDTFVNGRGEHCVRVGGVQIDAAVASAFLAEISPAGLEASLKAVEEIEANRDAALAQWERQVERARYEAQRAERRYRAVDPDNRLVARGLEAEWEEALRTVDAAETELTRRQQQRPRELSAKERSDILSLGADLERVWSAPTTTDRDRKELLNTLLEEVLITVDREKKQAQAHLTLRWRGGLLSELEIDLQRSRPAPIRTDDDTIELVRRLAVHHPDAVIAGILTRQGRTTATGLRFNADRVAGLRAHWHIPCFKRPKTKPEGELLNLHQTAEALGVANSTVHRWVNDGFIPAEQVTPGAPWRIRMTEELRSRFVEEAPEGYVTMADVVRVLGVSRQTVMQRVKRGELDALHVRDGRRKGLRIKLPDKVPGLFDL